MASGSGGIQFNGDTAAANALDDYEEGTWTPSVALDVPGTSAVTNAVGKYVKIGGLVHVTGRLTITKGTGSGDLTLGAFPFAAVTLSNYQCPVTYNFDAFGIAGTNYQGSLSSAATVPGLNAITQAGGAVVIASDSDFGASAATIRINATYETV
jgi:hypothetical protein